MGGGRHGGAASFGGGVRVSSREGEEGETGKSCRPGRGGKLALEYQEIREKLVWSTVLLFFGFCRNSEEGGTAVFNSISLAIIRSYIFNLNELLEGFIIFGFD